MKNNNSETVLDRPFWKSGRRLTQGFSLIEAFVSLALVAILASLAIPRYEEAIEKRRIANGGEQIMAFVNRARSESVKRNERIAVSYTVRNDGRWCLGAVLGNRPCDCTQSLADSPGFCAIDSSPWQLSDEHATVDTLIRVLSGDGSFTVDPIRGVFVDSSDFVVLGLQSGTGDFKMSLSVIPTGRPSLCTLSTGHDIAGYKSCKG